MFVFLKVNEGIFIVKADKIRREKKFRCSRCGKEFVKREGLKQHTQLHTGYFQYFCDKCKKGYNVYTAYKVHMDKHQGIKYQCEYCPKTFTSLQRRDYHTSVHTGNYRLSCNICNKGFNEQTHLKNTQHLTRRFFSCQ